SAGGSPRNTRTTPSLAITDVIEESENGRKLQFETSNEPASAIGSENDTSISVDPDSHTADKTTGGDSGKGRHRVRTGRHKAARHRSYAVVSLRNSHGCSLNLAGERERDNRLAHERHTRDGL